MNTMSASERTALAHFATLPMPIIATQSFAPLLPIHYHDGAGAEQWGKPDALCTQARTFTFIESKNGVLNHHLSRESCHRALQQEFERTMHDGRPKSYAALTNHFKYNNFPFMLENSYNQSLHKVLALQSLHGFEKFLVVFAKNPSLKDAQRYAAAGLVWCTHDTVAQMLGIIEFAAHGLYYPFHLRAPRAKYEVTVNPMPNPAHEGLTGEQITAANRAAYEEVVAATIAARGSATF